MRVRGLNDPCSCGIHWKRRLETEYPIRQDGEGWHLYSRSGSRLPVVYCITCGGTLAGLSLEARGGAPPEEPLPETPCPCLIQQADESDSPVEADLRRPVGVQRSVEEGAQLALRLVAAAFAGQLDLICAGEEGSILAGAAAEDDRVEQGIGKRVRTDWRLRKYERRWGDRQRQIKQFSPLPYLPISLIK